MSIISVEDFKGNKLDREKVVILSQQDFNEAMSNYEKGKFLLDENICYLVNPSRAEDINTAFPLQDMYKKGNLKSGNILILEDRNNDIYLPYEELLKNTVEAQLHKFIELCQLVGARKVRLDYQSSSKESSNTAAHAKANLKGLNAQAGFKNQIVNDVLGEMSVETEFSGYSKPDIAKAQRIMSLGIFDDNEDIKSFYNIACHQDNKMSSRKVKIKLAQDVSKKLEVFADINAAILKKSIGSMNFERVKNASHVCEINYEVIF